MSGDPRPCKLCGMRVLFRPGPGGKVIPLQRVRTVYTMRIDRRAAAKLEVAPQLELYVSHFETCPHAGQFRTRAPKPAEPAQ